MRAAACPCLESHFFQKFSSTTKYPHSADDDIERASGSAARKCTADPSSDSALQLVEAGS